MTPYMVREIRRALGVTQRELGRKLGVSRESVARWESNSRQHDVDKAYQQLLWKLCQERGVQIQLGGGEVSNG